ncbi:hypothetical protein NC653_033200 [Populus alba x Populus x berolinensis]|uniref:Uncharacterized protein n=1 Tax=Populus alba x Populus x berolinensis TaxID=444605 RepID=A0AAD6LUA4_9ROSI|nr:hypothetical protein NC653_033200 [Populus alba x Populus x berolinensis]
MWFSSPTGRLKDNLRFGHGLFKPSRISSCIQTLGAGLRANPIRNKSCYQSHLCLTAASFIIHAWKVLEVLQLWLFYIELRASGSGNIRLFMEGRGKISQCFLYHSRWHFLCDTERILKVLVSVHNLSATIRDLRVDYDVVI